MNHDEDEYDYLKINEDERDRVCHSPWGKAAEKLNKKLWYSQFVIFHTKKLHIKTQKTTWNRQFCQFDMIIQSYHIFVFATVYSTNLIYLYFIGIYTICMWVISAFVVEMNKNLAIVTVSNVYWFDIYWVIYHLNYQLLEDLTISGFSLPWSCSSDAPIRLPSTFILFAGTKPAL